MDAAEYERRRKFMEEMSGMSRAEYVEIARILRRHNVTISENRSGMYFDMSQIPQVAFEDLLKFRDFVRKNNVELEGRDKMIKSIWEAGNIE